jgi:hypothetical protein
MPVEADLLRVRASLRADGAIRGHNGGMGEKLK